MEPTEADKEQRLTTELASAAIKQLASAAMKPAPSALRPRMLTLARDAVRCNSCFTADDTLKRAGIGMAQPFTVGSNYEPGGVAIVGINPGASKDGGYKEARKRSLDRFAAGDDLGLLLYWRSLAIDATLFWNPKYLARLERLGLELDQIATGNVALCATEGNKYPRTMLLSCWKRHSFGQLKALAPRLVIFMGAGLDEFRESLTTSLPGCAAVSMAHFAHREGNAHERTECDRVRAIIESKAAARG